MYLPNFFDYLSKEKNFSRNTVIAYRKDLETFKLFCLDHYEISNISKVSYQIIRDWIIDLSEGIDLNLFLLRKFEPEILDTAKILAIKSKNKNILDIGANIGVHTLQFAKNFKDKKIHSIEPTSYCFKKSS